MAQNATIRPQQIERARKLLQDLPEKEDRKTRPEAAELLERDFRKAKEKGYNPRELSQMLKNEGIIIPAYLIKRFFSEDENVSAPQKKETTPVKKHPTEKASLLSPILQTRICNMNMPIFYVEGNKEGNRLGYFRRWIELVNATDEFPGHCLVINSAARSNTGIAKYGSTLRETLAELNRNFVTFWVINRQRDSVELLRGFLNVFPDALIHVCRNLYFGSPCITSNAKAGR